MKKSWDYEADRIIAAEQTDRIINEMRNAEQRANHPTSGGVGFPKWILYGILINLFLLGYATNNHMSVVLNNKVIMIAVAIAVFVITKLIDRFIFHN